MKTVAAFLLTCTLASAACAQQRRQTTLGGGLEIGIPIGEFDDTWGRQMAGVSGNFTIPMRRLPLSYGFDFGWARMGSERHVVTIAEENIESTTGDLSVKSNVYGYHTMVRLQPFTGKVSPYMEVMGGMRQFTTSTTIDVDGLDQPLYETRNENDFIGSVGWAAGVMVAPGKNFYVEGRVERLDGGQVTYVDPRSIAISPEGEVGYSTLTSGTRVVNITFGVGIRF